MREARLVSTSCRFLLLTPCNVPAYALETGLPENLRASRREGRPGTLLAKLSVVQDGAPGGRLSCGLGYCVGIYFTGFWL